MALTGKQLDNLVDEVLSGSQERFLQELTDSASSRFEAAMQGIGGKQVAEAQLEQLARDWPAEAKRLLAEYSDAISDEVRRSVEDTLKASIAEEEFSMRRCIAIGAATGNATVVTQTFERRAAEAAKGIAEIVRRQNILMEEAAERLWYQTCEEAVSRAVIGTMPQSEIIAKGVERMASIGCTHVTYGRGGVQTIANFVDVAVRRHVRTQTAQAGARITSAILDSYGHDLVITDAHWGARPSHAEWQGKPCCMKGKKTVDGVDYPDIRDLTGYGTVTGLLGANCAHSISPYYPGITPLPDRDFKRLEKHYGMTSDEYYEVTQRQRAWERRIRKTKREIAVLEDKGFGLESPTYVQKRLVLGRQQSSLAKLCREKNLPRQYEREHAYGVASQPRALRASRSFDYSKAKPPSVVRMHNVDTFAANYAASPVERGMVFDKSGNDLMRRAAKGTRNHVDIPLPDGCKDWHALHVAHTHPDGGTLSVADIREFNRIRPLSTSVAADGGVYSLMPAEGTPTQWVNFVKSYEKEYTSASNRLLDKLEESCLENGRAATKDEYDLVNRQLGIMMHEWMLANARRYGMSYGFSSLG